MELSEYLRILRKNWIVVAVIALLGVGSAAVYSLTRTPMYESSSRIFVSSQGGSSLGELQQVNSYAQARMTSYVQLATSPTVLDPVISELGLGDSAAQLASRLTVTNTANSLVLNIAVADTDPTRAAETANVVADKLGEAIAEVETMPDSQASPVKVTTIQPALAPGGPVSPNVPLNLALGLLVGLALGVGFAILRTALDTRVRSTRDIEAITDSPIIGAIPMDPRAKERPIILQADPLNPRSEAFRIMRTNLQFLDLEGDGHSFVITSSVPSEGKSTTSINLAIALADAGKRVVLIDADLRKPKVADYLGVEGGVGLTDVLIGRAELTDVLQKWGRRSLYILPSGKIPPNPSELLGSTRMGELLEAFTRDADIVILDAPPLLPVTDAAVLAKRTSGAILIVHAGQTQRNQLSSAIDALETVHAPVAGIVLSMIPTSGPDAYDYGYTYGYGYGYEPDEVPAAPTARAAKGRRGRRSEDDGLRDSA
ncbi:polysaccharide biosynthesis tyrosine autokinase [Microbacterium album]|uniref:polysaccharide biosynthesis tyrosine autokinase n=1 Tax=Microbacterium album TaxID=2053191 RepID=UPI001663B235|nr:polysaccharide biosynthesis tyrosine autokinase [Microbacterium album]